MPRTKSFQPDDALDQMMMIFWEQGYESTSIADLEDATGLNKRSLYNTFGNKEAIFAAALGLYLDRMSGMNELLLREPMGVANIKDFFAAMRYEPGMFGCLLTKTVNEEGVPKGSDSMAREAILGLEKVLRENLRAAELSPAASRSLAAFLTTMVQGITTMARVDPDPKRLRDVVRNTLDHLDHVVHN